MGLARGGDHGEYRFRDLEAAGTLSSEAELLQHHRLESSRSWKDRRRWRRGRPPPGMSLRGVGAPHHEAEAQHDEVAEQGPMPDQSRYP